MNVHSIIIYNSQRGKTIQRSIADKTQKSIYQERGDMILKNSVSDYWIYQNTKQRLKKFETLFT